MNLGALAGAGVLVTRPADQAGELTQAVEAAGGRAYRFPVIDIVPRESVLIDTDIASLPPADIVVYVSRNAVRYGRAAGIGQPLLAAVGKGTATELERTLGRPADIVPARGYDSEALLAEPQLVGVAGKQIRIVRGDGGRALLGEVLTARGARVDYLSVYARRRARPAAVTRSKLAADWRAGRVHYAIAMSVASFDNLLALLPGSCRKSAARARLVTPSSRVIQTATDQAPEMHALLAAGPGANDMVAAMAADWQTRTDTIDD